MTTISRRERLLWIAVFSVPPCVGMTGFVAISFYNGALAPVAVGVGLLTGLAVGALVGGAFYLGPDEDDDPPDIEPGGE